jgi:hypothetical protein
MVLKTDRMLRQIEASAFESILTLEHSEPLEMAKSAAL